MRSFVPTAKIESVRFRSVAFSKPVVALPDDDEDAKGEGKRARREKARAAAWRNAQDADEGRGTRRGEDDVVDKSKSFLDAKGKRKVAFIKKDVSTLRATESEQFGLAELAQSRLAKLVVYY